MVQPLWKTVWRLLKKLKTELPCGLAISLLGIFPKKTKTLIGKGLCTPVFIATLFTIAKIWKQPKCSSIDKWIKILLSHKKKNEILPLQQHGWT